MKHHLALCSVEQYGDDEDCTCSLIISGKNAHLAKCPKCKKDLDTLENRPGGGSHYWRLYCYQCEQAYSYSNYNYSLYELEIG